MVLKKFFAKLSSFFLCHFIPSSKEYFSREINLTYSKIALEKKDISLSNETQIRFNSLKERVPLIEDIYYIRKHINSYDEYLSLSFAIFDEYYKRLKDANTHYYIDSSSRKSTTFAENVVFNNRNLFYSNIDFVFLYIEKQHSLYLKNSTSHPSKGENKNPKKYINYLAENLCELSTKFYSDTCYALIAYKLHSLNLINLSKRGTKTEIHKEFIDLFKKEFSYDNFCATTKELVDDIELKKEQKDFFEKLSFLDELK